jgi:phenylpropionate dioxygenase-like ring-hydroxylating dioxygenase large terminal subunit
VQGLPLSTYLDPARAQLEAATVFAPSWQFVCHVADLPATGTAVRFDCAGRSAVVLRTRSGELQAYRNACRHRGARLVEGDPHTGLAFCVDGHLRCPYHGWTYDEAGSLVSIPAGQQFDATFDPAAHSLLPVHVEQWRGLVFVAFARPRHGLAAALDAVAGDWPELASMRRVIEPRSVACAADWKLAAEHLLDTSHLEIARPGIKPRAFEAPRFQPSATLVLRAVATVAQERAGECWSARAYRELLRRERSDAEPAMYLFVWPNVLLLRAADGLAVLQVLPGVTGHCTYRELRYAVPDSARASRLLRYLHQRVRRQALAVDVRLLGRVQQGLANLPPDDAAPLAQTEPGLQWFANRYRDHFAAAPAASKAASTRRRSRSRPAPIVEV